MRGSKIILAIFIALVLSCQSQSSQEAFKSRFHHHTKISISTEEFQIITHTKSYAIGDYSESFEVELDTTCYERIFPEIVDLYNTEQVNDSTFQFILKDNTNQITTIIIRSNNMKLKLTETEL